MVMKYKLGATTIFCMVHFWVCLDFVTLMRDSTSAFERERQAAITIFREGFDQDECTVRKYNISL